MFNQRPRFTVVVPTIRPEVFLKFLRMWEGIFKRHEVSLVIVEDNLLSTEDITEALDKTGLVYSHINRKDAIDIFHYTPIQSDMIRSAGFLRAQMENKHDSTYLVTLDDDVEPGYNIFDAYSQVFSKGAVLSKYFSISALTDSSKQMRGFPFKDRHLAPVGVQYGGWSGVLDYDAITQFQIDMQPTYGKEKFDNAIIPLPLGVPTTCCIMNTAWRSELTSIMWQLPMLEGRYNRFGDIWSGLFIKKTLDLYQQVMVINGRAQVVHNKASNKYMNLQRESVGYEINEGLWDALNDVTWKKWKNEEKGHSCSSCAEPDDTKEEHEILCIYEKVTDAFITYMETKDLTYAEYFHKARDYWLKTCKEILW